jgi:SpoVK/Ycf46/Vps4 family AAA+-type ATPase
MPLKPHSKPLKSHCATFSDEDLRRDFPIDGKSVKFSVLIEKLRKDGDESVKKLEARSREEKLKWFLERLYPTEFVKNKPEDTCRKIYDKYPLSAVKFAKALRLKLDLKGKSVETPKLSNVAVKLQKLIDCNTPIICIQNHDTSRVDAIIAEVCDPKEIIEWTPGAGAIKFVGKNRAFEKPNFSGMLSYILEPQSVKVRKGVFVLRDIDTFFELSNPEYSNTISALHLIAQRKLYDPVEYDNQNRMLGYDSTVIIVSSKNLPIPAELRPYVSYLEIPLPDEVEIDNIIKHHLEINNITQKDDLFKKAEAPRLDKIRNLLKGLSAFDIDRILDKIISENGKLTDDETESISEQKRLAIKNSGLLEFVENKVNVYTIGGLDYLKKYLAQKGQVMSRLDEARKYGCAMPKGIMLVGMPGCGKSMCAQAAAAYFNNIPLLRMDIGKLQGKYVGESEQNMREAIRITEAAAPCILWIDEVEKAFAGTDSGHEAYTARMFGFFLTWLQDRTSQVYVIATANKFHLLPPEFRRKGRFDEMFFMDLPDDNERKAIFNAQMNAGKRALGTLADYPKKEVDELIKATEDCNGADINAIIDTATEKMFLESINKSDRKKVIATMLDVAKKTIGINKSCGNELKKMKEEISKNFLIDATTGKKIEPKENKSNNK